MAKLVASLIAFHLVASALGHGQKAKPVPRLSPETLAAIGAAATPVASIAPTSQTAATCFAGYTLYSDGSCVKEIDEPAIPSTGEVTLPYIVTCPPGYEPSASEVCLHTSYSSPDFFCPAGYADDGAFCTSPMTSPIPEKVCELGELIGNSCIARVTAPYLVTPECPEGSQVEEDGGCWKVVETFDCTPHEVGKSGRVVSATRPSSSFSVGQHVRVTKGQNPLVRGAAARALGGKKAKHCHGKDALPVVAHTSVVGPMVPGPSLVNPIPAFPVELPPVVLDDGLAAAPGNPNSAILNVNNDALDGECTKDLVAVTPPHAFKVGLASQTCSKKIQVDALALVSCPEEYFDDGVACVKEIITEPSLSCPGSGGAVDGVCIGPISRIPKIQKCGDGSSPLNGQCLNIESIPGRKTCGAGFTDVGTGCFGIVSTGEGYDCPEGLKLAGDRCIGQIVRPAVAITMTAEQGSCSK